MRNRIINAFFLFLFQTILISPQTFISNTDIYETRTDKYLRLNNHQNLVSATDHLPLFINNPLDHWTASKFQLTINGIVFDQFPLNLNSPNFLPINYPNVSTIKQEISPELKPFSSGALEFINIIENSDLPDSFLFNIRTYIGSETGDPLIHIFTKENLQQTNRNKIPFSGSLSFSDKISETNYWFSIGYYGSYSTGSVNDGIIYNKSNYYFRKQNKQIFGSAGFKTQNKNKQEYLLSTSVISFYGWDIPPFITSFIHLETYLYTIRASAKNIIDGLSIHLANDGSISEIHSGHGIPSSRFNLSKYSLLGEYAKEYESFNFKISSYINYNIASNRKSTESLSKNFFEDEINKTAIGINPSIYFWTDKNIHTSINLGLKNYLNETLFSGSLGLKYYLTQDDNFSIKISSVESSPNLTELYGSFFLINQNSLDSFFVSGNSNLIGERINYLGVKYSGILGNLKLAAELYGENINYPIRQKTIRTKINESGEIFRDAVYINASNKKTLGTNLGLEYNINNFNSFSSFRFTENSEILYYPRYSFFSKLEYSLPINSKLQINFNFISKTIWEEFIVDSENDFYKGTGEKGELGNKHFFNFAYYQNLRSLFFLKNLNLGFSIRNVFNNKLRFLPIGNFLERSIVFSLNTEI